MPLSTDVTLDRAATARFPETCIVCHAVPDATVSISESSASLGIRFLLPIVLLFSRVKITLPVCYGCRGQFRMQRWGREALLWICAFIAIAIAIHFFGDLPRETRRWLFLGVLLAAVVPAALIDVIWARYFEASVSRATICYEFRSRDYAYEFHALNRDAVVESDINESEFSESEFSESEFSESELSESEFSESELSESEFSEAEAHRADDTL